MTNSEFLTVAHPLDLDEKKQLYCPTNGRDDKNKRPTMFMRM